jgi:hypothetical protein
VTLPLIIALDHDRSPRQIWVRVSRLASTMEWEYLLVTARTR